MAILAKLSPTAVNTEQLLYTVPTGNEALFAVRACNTGSTAAMVSFRLLKSNETLASPGGYIEYTVKVEPSCILEDTGINLLADEKIAITSSSLSVNFTAVGQLETV